MWDFIRKLFDASDFPPRWHCGNWDTFLGWMHIVSDIVIWAAYMAIPMMLFYFVQKKKGNLPFNYIFLLFCSFIFWCGTVHLAESVIFWYPWYRVSALIKFITAIVSVLTAIVLFKVIPMALELKTPHDLQEEVTRRTKELEHVSQELKRSNEELEQFAYVASHDLQEPLRMVSQSTERLGHYLGEQLDEKTQKLIGFASEGAQRMQVLIEDLLDFSRITRIRNESKPVDLNKVLRIVKLDLKVRIEETGAVINSTELPTINGDEIQLRRLFQNLISNSLKYRHQDRKPEIDISATKNSDHWLIEFKDNGIGFNQEHAERIFLLFQRLHPKSSYSGTGIGLTVCKKVIEQHNGEIWAEGKVGEGVSFFIKLPLE